MRVEMEMARRNADADGKIKACHERESHESHQRAWHLPAMP